MRKIHKQKINAFRSVFCMWIWRILQCFFAYKLAAFRSVFLHIYLPRFALFFAHLFAAFRTVFCMLFWKLSQRKRWPLVWTATHQFYAEKWGFLDGPGKNMKKIARTDTVLVEILRKLRVARVQYCVFRGAEIPGKKTKISRNFESEGFLKCSEKA